MMQALVVDDDPQVRRFVSQVLEEDGWQVSEAESAEEALECLAENNWAIIFCDVVLGGADGFTVLRRCKEQIPNTRVVLMTGHGSAAGALDATAFGAYDYLLKPFGVDQIQSLSRALLEQFQRRLALRYVSPGGYKTRYESDIDLIGRSAAFIEVMKQVGRVAGTNLSVLLTGESGTGKEVIASALHCRSRRAANAFVAVNCGAIPAELIEAELFGHVRGAFTGADRDRRGIWEEADGGTVFLDEITETSLAFQVKLLRVLQEREIRRVGSSKTEKVDVRVIAASNKDVEEEVNAGRFRADLFYRLNAVSIALPPLRERKEDILPLAQKFAEQIYSLNTAARFSPEALIMLEQYSWPGNIRELENAVVRAAVMSEGVIRPENLPERIRKSREVVSPHGKTIDNDDDESLPELADVTARYVKRVLTHTRGNKQAAAKILGVDRKTLDRMLKKYKIAITGVMRLPPRAA